MNVDSVDGSDSAYSSRVWLRRNEKDKETKGGE